MGLDVQEEPPYLPIQFQGSRDCGILQFENIIPGQLKRLVGACSMLVSDEGLVSLDMLTIPGQVPFPFHCFTLRLHKHMYDVLARGS